MPRMGFEPTLIVFEWAKTVHALDRAATVIGRNGGISPVFLTSALDGGEWSASRTGCFILLDAMQKRRIYYPCQEYNLISRPSSLRARRDTI
jgi:hypothetical protein